MSKNVRILLGLSLVWLVAWSIAAWSTFRAAAERSAEADYVASPATGVERGANVRISGTIADGAAVTAPFSQKPCVAAVTRIWARSVYTDSQNKRHSDAADIETRPTGPTNIGIVVGEQRIELPLERWAESPPHGAFVSEYMDELPSRLGVSSDEIDEAKAKLRGSFVGFGVSEWTMVAGTPVFVVGRLEERADVLRLEPDPVLKRIEVYPGTQAELVAELRKGASKVPAIVFAGVGSLPLVAFALIALLKRRNRVATAGDPSAT